MENSLMMVCIAVWLVIDNYWLFILGIHGVVVND
jgi:hypothetical protein